MGEILNNADRLAECAAEQHRLDPALTGKLILQWAVRVSGEVDEVQLVTPEFSRTSFAPCVTAVVKSMVFPRHQHTADLIQFPFKF